MNALRSGLAASVGVLLLLSVLPFAAADAGQGEELRLSEGPLAIAAEDGRLAVSNANVTVWFQDYRPMVHIFYTGENGTSTGFTVAVRGIYELGEDNMTVALLDLNRPYPVTNMTSDGPYNHTSSVWGYYQADTQTVDVIFNLTASEFLIDRPFLAFNQTPEFDGNGRLDDVLGPASVSAIFHISADTAIVKFDLIVSQWTWANASGGMLAVALTIDGHEITDSFGQRPTVDGTAVGANQAESQQLTYTVHSTYYRDSVRILGTELIAMGYLTWADSASVTYENATTATASVAASMYNCSADESAAARIMLVFLVPEGWATNYAALHYDPVIGLGELMPAARNSSGGWLPGWQLSSAGALSMVIAAAATAAVIVAVLAILLSRRE